MANIWHKKIAKNFGKFYGRQWFLAMFTKFGTICQPCARMQCSFFDRRPLVRNIKGHSLETSSRATRAAFESSFWDISSFFLDMSYLRDAKRRQQRRDAKLSFTEPGNPRLQTVPKLTTNRACRTLRFIKSSLEYVGGSCKYFGATIYESIYNFGESSSHFFVLHFLCIVVIK